MSGVSVFILTVFELLLQRCNSPPGDVDAAELGEALLLVAEAVEGDELGALPWPFELVAEAAEEGELDAVWLFEVDVDGVDCLAEVLLEVVESEHFETGLPLKERSRFVALSVLTEIFIVVRTEPTIKTCCPGLLSHCFNVACALLSVRMARACTYVILVPFAFSS